MFKQILTKRDIAERFHRLLPDWTREYLKARGIPDSIIERQLLGWNGQRITIPIFDRTGKEVLSFRYAKSPRDSSDSPKMLSEEGSHVELYGWEALGREPHHVVICEGEFDRLVLESHGYPAVTSTAGAGVFLPEWADAFAEIPRVYICFDRDPIGYDGAEKVKKILPSAAIVELPSDVGDKGDVTDFFVRLGRSRVDFDLLLADAIGRNGGEESEEESSGPHVSKQQSSQARRLKSQVRIEDVIACFLDLHPSGKSLRAFCPFHKERSPSLTVYPKTQTYFCFGCHAHGDVITFLMKKESMTFGQALEALERFTITNELFGTS